jgi:hypothetical protein
LKVGLLSPLKGFMFGISLWLGVHIACGSCALLTLLIPFLSKWGGLTHRRSGWVFSLAMAGVCLSAWALMLIRLGDNDTRNNMDALFLGHIGLLSGASVWMGLAATRIKNQIAKRRWPDLVWQGALLLSSAVMGIAGVIRQDVLWILFAVLGGLGAIASLHFLLVANGSRHAWMVRHLGSMGTGAISAVTAFVVVNFQHWGLGEYTLALWIAPGILGGTVLSLLSVRVNQHGLARPNRKTQV